MAKSLKLISLAIILAFVLLTNTFALAGGDSSISATLRPHPDGDSSLLSILKLAKNDDIHLELLKSTCEMDTAFINFAEPARWHEKAAEQGVAISQRILADRLSSHLNPQQNFEKAYELYKKAAEQNEILACYTLGLWYWQAATHIPGTPPVQIQKKKIDPAQAHKWLHKAAESGHSHSQYLLGDLFSRGLGVAKNSEQAEYWWELSQNSFHTSKEMFSKEMFYKAHQFENFDMDVSEALRLADQGNTEMQLLAAKIELWPLSVPPGSSTSFEDVHKWLEMSATRGDVEAMWRLAESYRALKQYDKAFHWHEKAAAANSPDALLRLGKYYYFGTIIDRDYDQARKNFEKSARLGNPEAQFYMGLINFFGQGVEQDMVKAYMWYSLAAAPSSAEEAVLAQKLTAEKMTPEQISKSKDLINNFKSLARNN